MKPLRKNAAIAILEFRRFQVDTQPIEMDDPSKIDQLTAYGGSTPLNRGRLR
jgi:hypothetical protein